MIYNKIYCILGTQLFTTNLQYNVYCLYYIFNLIYRQTSDRVDGTSGIYILYYNYIKITHTYISRKWVILLAMNYNNWLLQHPSLVKFNILLLDNLITRKSYIISGSHIKVISRGTLKNRIYISFISSCTPLSPGMAGCKEQIHILQPL